MATPLTDSINALTQYANETTGKQDTTLSDAVGSLVEGYGQGGAGETIIVTKTATNMLDSFKAIFGDGAEGYLYMAFLVDKPKATWKTDQFIGAIAKYEYGSYSGTGLRYRNANISTANVASNYDAQMEIGDTYIAVKTLII